MPEVSSATDTSNFDVDIESSKANVSAGSLFEQAYELLWSPLFQAGTPEFKLWFDLCSRSQDNSGERTAYMLTIVNSKPKRNSSFN